MTDQPKPQLFYKSCFELEYQNMVSILSFDSRSIAYLLGDEFEEYFSDEFPLFYKNKVQRKPNSRKYNYRTAIDTALKVN